MRDALLHNDCDGGACCACAWGEEQERHAEFLRRSAGRAWFNPNPPGPATTADLLPPNLSGLARKSE